MDLIMAAATEGGFGVVLPVWVYFAVGIPALGLFVFAGIKTLKDNKAKKEKKNRR